MFKELQIVRTLTDQVCSIDGDPIPAGTIGTVVMVYAGGAAYEVETIAPSGLFSVRHHEVISGEEPLVLRLSIEIPTSHRYKSRVVLMPSGFDDGTKRAVATKIDEWCASRWERDEDWYRSFAAYLLRTEAMAFEFKMRWDGAQFHDIFG